MALIITSKTRAIGNRAPVGPFELNKDSPSGDVNDFWPLFTGNFAELRSGKSLGSATGTNKTLSVIPSAEGEFIQIRAYDGDGTTAFDTGGQYGVGNPLALTVSSWWNESGNYFSSEGQRDIISSRSSGNGGWTFGQFDAVDGPPGNAATVHFTMQGVAVYSQVGMVPARGWHHVAITWQPSIVKFYLDGILFGSSVTVASITATTENLTLFGGGPINSGFSLWNHAAFGVGAWSRVLNDAEIYSLWSPQTRWDLLWQKRKTISLGAANAIALSLPTQTSITQTGATVGATTDFAGGILYAYVKAGTSPTPPSKPEMVSGSGAAFHGTIP